MEPDDRDIEVWGADDEPVYTPPAATPGAAPYSLESAPTVEAAAQLTREMEAIAIEARDLMQNFAGRVKLDLHTQAGWSELLGMLTSDRVVASTSPQLRDRLRRCAARWQQRYRHLCYVTSTRPVWNS